MQDSLNNIDFSSPDFLKDCTPEEALGFFIEMQRAQRVKNLQDSLLLQERTKVQTLLDRDVKLLELGAQSTNFPGLENLDLDEQN